MAAFGWKTIVWIPYIFIIIYFISLLFDESLEHKCEPQQAILLYYMACLHSVECAVHLNRAPV